MTRAEILAVVHANIAKVVEGTQDIAVDEEASMRDLGADSLEIVEVVSRSMRELKIKVPRTELATAKNIKDLVDLFAAKVSEQSASGGE
jgi:acyl carrier protein